MPNHVKNIIIYHNKDYRKVQITACYVSLNKSIVATVNGDVVVVVIAVSDGLHRDQ